MDVGPDRSIFPDLKKSVKEHIDNKKPLTFTR